MTEAMTREELLEETLRQFYEVADSAAVRGVFVFYAVHGQKYDGPAFDMETARQLLGIEE